MDNMNITERRELIVDQLTEGFRKIGSHVPKISISEAPEDVDHVSKLALKGKKFKNVIYVTWGMEDFKPRISNRLYNTTEVYALYLFSHDIKSDVDIIRLYEKCRDILYANKYWIYRGEGSRIIKIQSMYMAVVHFGLANIYPKQ